MGARRLKTLLQGPNNEFGHQIFGGNLSLNYWDTADMNFDRSEDLIRYEVVMLTQWDKKSLRFEHRISFRLKRVATDLFLRDSKGTRCIGHEVGDSA